MVLIFCNFYKTTIHNKLVVLPIPVICCFGMTTSPCLDIGSFKSFMEDDITSPNITRRPNSSVWRFYKQTNYVFKYNNKKLGNIWNICIYFSV